METYGNGHYALDVMEVANPQESFMFDKETRCDQIHVSENTELQDDSRVKFIISISNNQELRNKELPEKCIVLEKEEFFAVLYMLIDMETREISLCVDIVPPEGIPEDVLWTKICKIMTPVMNAVKFLAMIPARYHERLKQLATLMGHGTMFYLVNRFKEVTHEGPIKSEDFYDMNFRNLFDKVLEYNENTFFQDMMEFTERELTM